MMITQDELERIKKLYPRYPTLDLAKALEASWADNEELKRQVTSLQTRLSVLTSAINEAAPGALT